MFESYLKTHEEQQKKTYQSFSFMCSGGGAGSFDTSSDPHQPEDDDTNVPNYQVHTHSMNQSTVDHKICLW